MTNIVGTILISLGTNWTGYVMEEKEAGIVVTNYQMQVKHEGQTYTYPLKTVKSGVAVWREKEWHIRIYTNMISTNHWYFYPNVKGL